MKIAMRVAAVAAMFCLCAGFKGCPNAAKTLKDFRISVGALQKAEIQVHQDGYISDADHKTNEGLIENVAEAGLTADEALLVLKSNQGAQAALQLALDKLNELNTAGITRIKNPLRQQEFRASIAAVSALIKNIEATLAAKGANT